MKRILSLFSNERGSLFRRNFVRVAKANIFAQLLLLAFMPLLTRVYGPDMFGVAALFTTAMQIFGSVSTWRIGRIVPNTNNKQSAAALMFIGTVFLSVVVASTALLLFWAPDILQRWHGYDILGNLIYYLPAAIAGVGFQHLFRGWYARQGELSTISTARIIQTLSYIIIALAVGFTGLNHHGLIAAAALSVCFPLYVLMRNSETLLPKVKKLNSQKIRASIRPHISQATLATIVSLVNVTSLTAPVLLLAQLYSAVELGWYALMYRVVTTPLGTIMNALAISFWSRSAELVRENRTNETYKLYISVTKKMLIPATLVILFSIVAPRFISMVFGAEWTGAGGVLQAITPMLVGYALFSATNHLIVLRRQGLQLIADGLRLTLMLISTMLAAALDWSFESAVLALSLSSFFGHLCLFLIHHYVHRRLTTQKIESPQPRKHRPTE